MNKGRNRVGTGVILAKEKERLLVQAQKSCMVRTGEKTRRDPLSAVSRVLQLKYQDSGITFTNWDRIRLNPSPTTNSNRACALRQMPKKPSAVSNQLSAKIMAGLEARRADRSTLIAES